MLVRVQSYFALYCFFSVTTGTAQTATALRYYRSGVLLL